METHADRSVLVRVTVTVHIGNQHCGSDSWPCVWYAHTPGACRAGGQILAGVNSVSAATIWVLFENHDTSLFPISFPFPIFLFLFEFFKKVVY